MKDPILYLLSSVFCALDFLKLQFQAQNRVSSWFPCSLGEEYSEFDLDPFFGAKSKRFEVSGAVGTTLLSRSFDE